MEDVSSIGVVSRETPTRSVFNSLYAQLVDTAAHRSDPASRTSLGAVDTAPWILTFKVSFQSLIKILRVRGKARFT